MRSSWINESHGKLKKMPNEPFWTRDEFEESTLYKSNRSNWTDERRKGLLPDSDVLVRDANWQWRENQRIGYWYFALRPGSPHSQLYRVYDR